MMTIKMQNQNYKNKRNITSIHNCSFVCFLKTCDLKKSFYADEIKITKPLKPLK